MENKIPLLELSENIAVRLGISKKKAELMTRAFFEVVEAGLVKDNFVKIKKFGTFKLVSVSDRESVNVNTGERIQITGHSKVTFTPDTELKDLVNRPFAHFQTIVLNEDTPMYELDEVDQLDEDDIHEVLPTTTTPTETETSETALEDSQQIQSEEEKTDEHDTILNNTEGIDKVADADDTPIANVNADETLAVERTSKPTEEEPESTSTDNLMPEGDKPQKTDVSLNTDEYRHTEPMIQQPEAAQVPSPTTETEPQEDVDLDTDDNNEEEGLVTEVHTPRRYHSLWSFAGLCLIVLTLMVGSYFIGYYHLLCPCESQQATTTTTKTADTIKTKPVTTHHKDTIAAKPKTERDTVVKPKEPTAEELLNMSKQYSQIPGARYLIVGEIEPHRMSKGENLYAIAKRVYGNKDFARYIIYHNRISNPDIVPEGMKLRMPKLIRKP